MRQAAAIGTCIYQVGLTARAHMSSKNDHKYLLDDRTLTRARECGSGGHTERVLRSNRCAGYGRVTPHHRDTQQDHTHRHGQSAMEYLYDTVDLITSGEPEQNITGVKHIHRKPYDQLKLLK